ncbi:MAG: hypothetical protein J2P21_26840 [Chloracidobacterium sp.]|nr:hypothetical protein [Chloracidobacterium sp.]
MKSFFICGLLFCLAGSITLVAAQERRSEDKRTAQGANDTKLTNDQIEVKKDKFSNVTTVTLKPQVIFDKPNHQLTIEIMTKLGEKGQFESEKDYVKAEVWFRSQAIDLVDFGDQELHFLIDGNPLDLGRAMGDIDITRVDKGKLKPGFKISRSFVSIFHSPDLEQFSKARRIEMRLGSVELTFDQSAVASLREYATQVFAQHKIAKESKP